LIPEKTVYSSKKGDTGIVVWAIQRAINERRQLVAEQLGSLAVLLTEDGVFGTQTKGAVKHFQEGYGLLVDGVFGPATSSALATDLSTLLPITVPGRLVEGLVLGESGGLIGAVNHSVPGGIDCGYTQRRVYEADWANEAAVQRAFDARYQMTLFAKTLRSRHDAFFGRPGAHTHQAAWRLATLNHNYPSAADTISRFGIKNLPGYYTTPQQWVIDIRAHFPDGEPIRTPLEWCQHYALGSPDHNDPGLMTRLVTDWSVS
jgi:peptidoglycan hydrolase-like protein with peptidoglycan-binding domain